MRIQQLMAQREILKERLLESINNYTISNTIANKIEQMEMRRAYEDFGDPHYNIMLTPPKRVKNRHEKLRDVYGGERDELEERIRNIEEEILINHT